MKPIDLPDCVWRLQMNHERKRWRALGFLLLFLMSGLALAPMILAGPVTSVQLNSLDLVTDPPGQDTAFVGTNTVMYLKVNATNDTGTPSLIHMRVRISKDYIDPAKVLNSPPIHVSFDGMTETATHYELAFRHHLTGANVELGIPFEFACIDGATPKGHVVLVDAEVSDEAGGILGQTDAAVSITQQITNFTKTVYAHSATGSFESHRVTVNGGSPDPADNTRLSNDISQLDGVRFQFRIDNGFFGKGSRRIQEGRTSIVLPNHVFFDQASNPKWHYDANTRTASHVYTASEAQPQTLSSSNSTMDLYTGDAELLLFFPGALINQAIPLRFMASFTGYEPGPNEAPYTMENTIQVTPLGHPLAVSLSKQILTESQLPDDLGLKERHVSQWAIALENISGRFDFHDLEFIDRPGAHQHLVSMAWPATPATIFDGSFDLYGTPLGAQSEELIQAGIQMQQAGRIALPKPYARLRLRATQEAVLKQGQELRFQLGTKITDPVNSKVPEGQANLPVNNEVEARGHYGQMSEGFTGRIVGYMYLVPHERRFTMYKRHDQGSTALFPGDELHYEFSPSIEGLLPEDVLDYHFVDLLPPGFQYVEGSGQIVMAPDFKLNTHSTAENGQAIAPQVIPQYQGTNRTALRWRMPKATVTAYKDSLSLAAIRYRAKATRFANAGSNRNEVYWYQAGARPLEIVQDASKMKEDSLDVNENGNTTEALFFAEALVNFSPPIELIAQKELATRQSPSFSVFPSVKKAELNEPIQYRITLRNNTTMPQTGITALDILPALNDREVSLDENNQRPLRHSGFPIRLSKALTPLAGYKIYYTSDVPGDGELQSYTEAAHWVETPQDYGTVRAVKIVMEPGTSLGVEEQVSFTMEAKTPMTAAATENLVAYNSLGIADAGLRFRESNRMGTELQRYVFTGRAFEDSQPNGQFDQGERGLPGLLVELLNDDGSLASDLLGQVISTQTDAEGRYQLFLPRSGSFRLRIQTPAGYDRSEGQVLAGQEAAQVDPATGTSALQAVDAQTQVAQVHAAFRPLKTEPSTTPTVTSPDTGQVAGIGQIHGIQSPILRPLARSPESKLTAEAPRSLPATGAKAKQSMLFFALVGMGLAFLARKKH